MTKDIFELVPGFSQEDQEALRKMWRGDVPSRWGLGEKPGVLVVDMTRAFVEDRFPSGWEKTGRPCADAIGRLLLATRHAGYPTFFTVTEPAHHEAEIGAWFQGVTEGGMFPFDGPAEAHELVPELEPASNEIVVAKRKPSAFYGTQLTGMLIYEQVDSLIITGMTTSGCVRATVNDAFAYNYRVTVPVECVADRSQLSHRVELVDMGAKYADLVGVDDLIEELNRGADRTVGATN